MDATEVMDITVSGVDIGLLRKQRNLVLTTIETLEHAHAAKKEEKNALLGLVNMLDAMLDTAEGYPEPIQQNREERS